MQDIQNDVACHREPIDFNGFVVFILSQDKLHTPFF